MTVSDGASHQGPREDEPFDPTPDAIGAFLAIVGQTVREIDTSAPGAVTDPATFRERLAYLVHMASGPWQMVPLAEADRPSFLLLHALFDHILRQEDDPLVPLD